MQEKASVRHDLTPLRMKAKVSGAQSCPTLCKPMDCSPPGSSVHGILQGIFLNQGLTLGFPHCRLIPDCLSRDGHHQKDKKQNKAKKASAGEDAEKRESLHTMGRNANSCSHRVEQEEGSSRYLKLELPYGSATPLWGIFSQEMKTRSQRKVCSRVQCSFIRNSRDVETN